MDSADRGTALGIALWNTEMGVYYLAGALLIAVGLYLLLRWTWLRTKLMPNYSTFYRLANLAGIMVTLIQAKLNRAKSNQRSLLGCLVDIPEFIWGFLGKVAIAVAVFCGIYFSMFILFILLLAQILS